MQEESAIPLQTREERTESGLRTLDDPPAAFVEEEEEDEETMAEKMGRKIAKRITGIREKNETMREGTTFKVRRV